MARHRTWDSEAYTPYYEDDDPSLYRPSIWRRLLISAIVLVPVLAAALLGYSFMRAYIFPPTVSVAPTSLAMRERDPNMVVPMTTRPLADGTVPRRVDQQPPPSQTRGPVLAAARTEPEPSAGSQIDPSLLPWPGTAPGPRAAGTPPPMVDINGSIAALEAVPLPRPRPRVATAADAIRALPRTGAIPVDGPLPPPPAEPSSAGTRYGTPN
jgi:hypothetical protein